MKLLYSYMERLRVHLINVTSLFLSITPAINGHKLVYVRQVLFVLPFCFIMFSNAQEQSPDRSKAVLGKQVFIGSKVPKDFWTKEHLFFINGDTMRKSLQEYQGKMLVLDFWSSGCVPCLLPQKQIREYVDRYQGKLAVVLVNSAKTKDSFEKLNGLYEKGFFKQFGLENLESIILDEQLSFIFPYGAFPQYVWINEYGMLQLRTYRNLMDKNYLAPFVDKKP